ncbi:MAG: hypothetical protein EBS55_12120 [Flavobacteriaceae bacterium]|nr:hypothetical protein [Flavobacteriaceae bacterium]
MYFFIHNNKYSQRYKIYLQITIMFDIYRYINIKNLLVMGCGCKNQANQAPQQAPQQSNTQQSQSQPKTQPIQESIRKVVQKYYKK